MKTLFINVLFLVSCLCFLSFSKCDPDPEPDPITDQEYVVSGSQDGHDFVDLGLSVRWATCNIGAPDNNPSRIGQYYSWGGTSHQTSFEWADYSYWTDYNGDGYWYYDELIDLGMDISGTKYDVANKRWGSKWRMPTKTEMEELLKKCVISVTTRDNTFGFKLKGPNGNCIFLPATGYYDRQQSYSLTSGQYWTSSRCPNPDNDRAWIGSIGKSGYGSIYWSTRRSGLNVRAVCDK